MYIARDYKKTASFNKIRNVNTCTKMTKKKETKIQNAIKKLRLKKLQWKIVKISVWFTTGNSSLDRLYSDSCEAGKISCLKLDQK